MEIPTLGQLKLLLQENKTFRDYFNTFLNLPIFCRRFTYYAEENKFKVDPSLQSPYHIVAEAAMMSWIHIQRLPLFLRSQLYHEYTLCLEITKNNSCISDSSLLAGMVEMNHFRQFLSGTEGESACLFWLNVQQLAHILHTEQCEARDVARLIDRIRTNYINDDAPLCLSHDIRTELTIEFCRLSTANPVQTDLTQHPCIASLPSTHHTRYIQAITKAQAQVLTSLREYWCKKYISIVRNSKPEQSKTALSGMECSDGISTVKKPSVSPGLPDIITDEGHSKYHQKVSTKQPYIKLPDIATGNSFCSIRRPLARSPKVMLLFSSSTTELFLHSDLPLHPLQHASQPMESEYFYLHPFLNGSLRSDFLAGSPFLCYLSNSHHHNKTVNLLLFWQSAEVIFMQDEMRRWYPSRKRGWQKQQREREYPYVSCTHEFHPTAKNPMELVQLYLTKGSPYKIDLPSHTREELTSLLPKGLGQSLLISVQEFAAQQLLCPWKTFLSHDNQEFIKHCTTERLLEKLSPVSRKEHQSLAQTSLSPSEIVQHTYRSSQLKTMWLALRLAESAAYPGTFGLPSRRQTDITLLQETIVDKDSALKAKLEEDSNDISVRDLTGISLNPMVTTVQHTMKRDTKRSLHTILSVTKPIRSLEHNSKKVLPGNFKEILKDSEQLELFHRFLVAQGGGYEVQLLFWLAVEDIKSSMSNAKVYSRKMDRIVKKFFKNRDTKRVLLCPDSLVMCLSSQQSTNPLQLLAAQSAVGEAMERLWYGRYIASLTVEEKKKNEEETGETEQKQTKKSHICVEHTKDLWRMFAQGVISFRRGLMNPDTAEDFKSYLREEVVRGSSGSHKKVIGTKAVYVTKLLNDLSFWAEVERYKDLADIVKCTKKGRAHTPEDDIMVHKKAHAIINCFVDSAVMPRVQINIPNELVQYILDCVSQGEISRGLFHEAALNIFSVLILYWRKYLMIRHTHKKKVDGLAPSHTHYNPPPHTHRPHNLQKVASFDKFHPDNHILLDIGPTLSFSLSDGLHWVHRHHFEFATVGQLSSNHHLKTHRLTPHRTHSSRKHSVRYFDSFHQRDISHRSMKHLSGQTTNLSILTALPAVHS